MPAPVVAHFGPSGFLGGKFLPIFIEAAKNGDFAKLRLVSQKDSEVISSAIAAAPGKVEHAIVNYSDKATVLAALKGVDIVISTIGGGATGREAAEKALTEAAVEAKVKAYFNSEFGFDYDSETFDSAVFTTKKAHREAAEKLGLKTIAVATGAFSETAGSPGFGVNGLDWEISGDGNTPFTVTKMTDVARYVVRAAILANEDPSKLPSRLRVSSDQKTWNEMADIFEKVKGQKVNRVYVPMEKHFEKWNAGAKNENPFYSLRLAAGTPSVNYPGETHNELLNPGQKYFVPVSWE